MTNDERYVRAFYDISNMVGGSGDVNMYKPGSGGQVVILATLKFSIERPIEVDSYFNHVRQMAPEAKTKMVVECDPSNGGKTLVKITAGFGT